MSSFLKFSQGIVAVVTAISLFGDYDPSEFSLQTNVANRRVLGVKIGSRSIGGGS